MVVELLPTCQEVIRKAIKNPPTYHKGNQMVLVPYNTFRQLENAVQAQELAQAALTNDESSVPGEDDEFTGSLVSFV